MSIERLKELEAKATPGRWDHDASGYIFQADTQKEIDDDQGFNDAALIVEMRNALPKLLAVVEQGKALADYLDMFIQYNDPPKPRYEDVLPLLISWDAKMKALES